MAQKKFKIAPAYRCNTKIPIGTVVSLQWQGQKHFLGITKDLVKLALPANIPMVKVASEHFNNWYREYINNPPMEFTAYWDYKTGNWVI